MSNLWTPQQGKSGLVLLLDSPEKVERFLAGGRQSDAEVLETITAEQRPGAFYEMLRRTMGIPVNLDYEITYFIPDHPKLMGRPLFHQIEDTLPKLPRFRKILDYWVKHIEGKIDSVQFNYTMQPLAYRNATVSTALH